MRLVHTSSILCAVLLAAAALAAEAVGPTAEEAAFAARVKALAAAGKEEEAEKLCREEIERKGLAAQAQLSLGLLLADRARVSARVVPSGAKEDLDAAFNSDAETLARMGAQTRQGIEAGAAGAAIEALEEAIALAPRRFEAYDALADLYADVQRSDRETLHARRMLDAFGPSKAAAGAIQRVAQRHAKAGQDADAEALLKALAERAPDDATLQSDLGVLALRRGAHGEAAERFERAAALNPSDEVALMNLARVRVLRQEPERAAETYAKLVALKPRDDVARYEYALALSLTDPKRSAREWEAYLGLADPADPFRTAAREILEDLQGTRRRTERRWLDEARRLERDAPAYSVAALLHVLRADPDSLEANYTMAGVYDLLGFSDWTLRYLERCRELLRAEPALADTLPWSVLHANFGRAYYQGGRYEDAAAAYRAALESGADRAETAYALGAAYERAGKLAEAGRAFQEAQAAGGSYGAAAGRKLDRPDIREAISGVAPPP